MRTLSRRELGRALLARNLLLEPSTLGAVAAVQHLVGVQAQEPQEPYVGLFCRLAGSTRSSSAARWSSGCWSAP